MDEITLTDEQKQAVQDVIDRVCSFINEVWEEVKRLAQIITDAFSEWVNSLPPEFWQAFWDEFEVVPKKRHKNPPRKIGTPHPGFTNIKAIRPLRLC